MQNIPIDKFHFFIEKLEPHASPSAPLTPRRWRNVAFHSALKNTVRASSCSSVAGISWETWVWCEIPAGQSVSLQLMQAWCWAATCVCACVCGWGVVCRCAAMTSPDGCRCVFPLPGVFSSVISQHLAALTSRWRRSSCCDSPSSDRQHLAPLSAPLHSACSSHKSEIKPHLLY